MQFVITNVLWNGDFFGNFERSSFASSEQAGRSFTILSRPLARQLADPNHVVNDGVNSSDFGRGSTGPRKPGYRFLKSGGCLAFNQHNTFF